MIIDDPNDMDDIERKIKFAEIAREFGRSIAAFECAPYISEFELMRRKGIDCPPPDVVDKLDDDAVTALVWKVMEYYASRNTFPSPTDHLSDRALYRKLYEVAEEEPSRDWEAVLEPHELTQVGSWVQHIDLLPLDSDDDIRNYARWFVRDDDTKERANWASMLDEGQTLPPFEGAPFDRDRFLPKSLEDKLRERGEEPTEEQRFDHGEVDPRYDEFKSFDDDADDSTDGEPRRRKLDDDDIPF